MIEIISESRCIKCNLCVQVCPTNVFEAIPNSPPSIARLDDCQTCFMCELYCPVDAMYVSPHPDPLGNLDEAELIASGLMGSFRKSSGWGKGRTVTTLLDVNVSRQREVLDQAEYKVVKNRK